MFAYLTTARRLGSAAVVGLITLLAAADAHGFDPSCPYGVNAHQASNAALDKASAAGIGWVRFDMNWFQFEPSNDSYDWTISDRFTSHAASLGLNVFITIAYTPAWAVGAPCNDNDANEVNWCRNAHPANVSDWTGFVTAAVTRYGGQVKAWGMWNEPNLLNFYRGTRDQYVDDLLVPGSAAVHAACADCQVMAPELAQLRGANWDQDEGTCVAGNCIFNAWSYSLKSILQAAGGSIDVVTHHNYEDPAAQFWSELADGTFEVIKIHEGVKELTDQYVPGKPVWITEFGWETQPDGSHTEAHAAAQLTASYQGLVGVMTGTQPGVSNQPWPELDKLFWYHLHDGPTGSSWGLMDHALVERQRYTAYAAVIQSLGDCTGPWVPPGTGGAGVGGVGGGVGPGGGSGVGGNSGPGGGSAAGGVGASGGTTTIPGGDGGATDDDGGCGCRWLPSRSSGAPLAMGLLLAALGLRRRRR